MNNKVLTIIVIIVIIVFVGAYLVFNTGNQETSPPPSENSDDTQVDEETVRDETDNSDISAKNILIDSETLEGTLEDVAGIGASGTGYILRHEGRLYHYVEAEMRDPEEGSVYEGWLVDQAPELQFFSTGVMEKNAEGMYVLSYDQDGTSDEFDFVVITEEAVVDETPEAHIIEGSVTQQSSRYYCDCDNSLTICPGSFSAETRDCQSCCSTYQSGNGSGSTQ